MWNFGLIRNKGCRTIETWPSLYIRDGELLKAFLLISSMLNNGGRDEFWCFLANPCSRSSIRIWHCISCIYLSEEACGLHILISIMGFVGDVSFQLESSVAVWPHTCMISWWLSRHLWLVVLIWISYSLKSPCSRLHRSIYAFIATFVLCWARLIPVLDGALEEEIATGFSNYALASVAAWQTTPPTQEIMCLESIS